MTGYFKGVRYLFLIFIGIVVFNHQCFGNEETVPTIDGGHIHFSNGARVQLVNLDGSSASEYFLHVDDVSKTAHLVQESSFSEDEGIVLTIYSFDGKQLYKSEVFFGAVHFFEKSQRILLAKYSFYYLEGDSEIISYSGKKVADVHTIKSASYAGTSIINDKEYFWFTAENLINPESMGLAVFDIDGEKIYASEKALHGSSISLNGSSLKVNTHNLRLEGLVQNK